MYEEPKLAKNDVMRPENDASGPKPIPGEPETVDKRCLKYVTL